MEYYEYALKLAQISVDLCPESFEGWVLLAECYFYMRKIKRCLICMDIAPLYDDMELIHDTREFGQFEIIRPKIRNTTDTHSYLMLEPKVVDYRKPNDKTYADNLQLY